MNIIARGTLWYYMKRYSLAAKQLELWHNDVRKLKWKKSTDVLVDYPKARTIKNNRVIFPILGNAYCLIVGVDYRFERVFIIFFGTHAEYDEINAETIDYKKP